MKLYYLYIDNDIETTKFADIFLLQKVSILELSLKESLAG